MALSEQSQKLLAKQSREELERGYRELCDIEVDLERKLKGVYDAKLFIMLEIENKLQK